MSERESLHEFRRPKLLDLFCGAGGASKGYHDVGFEVVGVDISPQRNYPFEFIQTDVFEFLASRPLWEWVIEFDAIHASPPCQRYSDLAKRNGNADEHPDLIWLTREILDEIDLPYVIENVEGSPLNDPIRLCGTLFGLGVNGYRLRRHRLFESSNVNLVSPGCWCYGDPRPVIDVSGGGPTKAPRLDGKGGRTYKGTACEAREAMGIDWMTKAELNEAIPPVYTRIIGAQVLSSVQRAMAVAS